MRQEKRDRKRLKDGKGQREGGGGADRTAILCSEREHRSTVAVSVVRRKGVYT